MKYICLLKNTIQEYAWGSHTAIPELLGNKSPSDKPQAELWMGAHPKAPSMVQTNNKMAPLTDVIQNNPQDVLGKGVANKFNNSLPFLFKILAAGQPLSIQAHPNKKQAKEGFEKENSLGIPLNAQNRNYKDINHKPECICALTPFWAMAGFRKAQNIINLLDKISSHYMDNLISILKAKPDAGGLKNFFQTLMTLDDKQKSDIITASVSKAEPLAESDPVFKWVLNLYNTYPNDIGILSPVFLNLICLQPGQAMRLPAGELHAYLDGTGIELMANSDNVLRGGLTPKHIDVPELLNVLTFSDEEMHIVEPSEINDCERVYPSHAEEFVLSVISIEEGMVCLSENKRNVEIILCTDGKADVISDNEKLVLQKGASALIPAAAGQYTLKGNATIYKASVPT